jgi:hypothetical protein
MGNWITYFLTLTKSSEGLLRVSRGVLGVLGSPETQAGRQKPSTEAIEHVVVKEQRSHEESDQ